MAELTHLFGSARYIVILLIAALTLGACDLIEQPIEPGGTLIADSVSQSRSATVRPQGTYRLRPGDTISVFVFDNPDLSQEVSVAPDGRVSYPLAGSFRAQGKTLDETRRILASRFSSNIVAPQVSVSLRSATSYTVFVNGEVLQPGAFDLQGPTTLVQAITRAGGFTAFAKRDAILIYNPASSTGERRIFNYDQFVSDPRQKDILLKPGDTVIVL